MLFLRSLDAGLILKASPSELGMKLNEVLSIYGCFFLWPIAEGKLTEWEPFKFGVSSYSVLYRLNVPDLYLISVPASILSILLSTYG